jgi:hypothetical protein
MKMSDHRGDAIAGQKRRGEQALPPRELPRLLYCDVAELGSASRQSRANVKPFAVENRIGHYVLQHVSHEDEGNQSARVLGDTVLRQVLQFNTVLWCRRAR